MKDPINDGSLAAAKMLNVKEAKKLAKTYPGLGYHKFMKSYKEKSGEIKSLFDNLQSDLDNGRVPKEQVGEINEVVTE